MAALSTIPDILSGMPLVRHCCCFRYARNQVRCALWYIVELHGGQLCIFDALASALLVSYLAYTEVGVFLIGRPYNPHASPPPATPFPFPFPRLSPPVLTKLGCFFHRSHTLGSRQRAAVWRGRRRPCCRWTQRRRPPGGAVPCGRPMAGRGRCRRLPCLASW